MTSVLYNGIPVDITFETSFKGGVTGGTEIITDTGYVRIQDFKDTTHDVWDGTKFVPCTAVSTGSYDVVYLETSSKDVLRCSKNFKINGTEVQGLKTLTVFPHVNFPEIMLGKTERCARVRNLVKPAVTIREGNYMRWWTPKFEASCENVHKVVKELRLLGVIPSRMSKSEVSIRYQDIQPLHWLVSADYGPVFLANQKHEYEEFTTPRVESITFDGTREEMFALRSIGEMSGAFYNGIFC